MPRPSLLLQATLPFFLLLSFGPTAAQCADVARVEEDWELELDVVSISKQAPQFETLMSPLADGGYVFARATWNYRELPDYVPGGYQLQAWVGNDVLATKQREAQPFSTAGETVTWTQELGFTQSLLYFQIKNGHSTTWGAFGGSDAQLRLDPQPSNLNGYSSVVSAQKSGISYGANRVISLRIKQVRRYDAAGNLLSVDNTPYIVHQR